MNTAPTPSASGRLRTAFLVVLMVVAGLWVVLSREPRNGTTQRVARVLSGTTDDRARTAAQLSVSVPDDFPDDMPLYPDARVSTVDQRTRQSPYTMELIVQDDMASVRSHYERLLRQSAWSLQSVSGVTGVHITLQKGSRSATVLLETLTERPSATRIILTVPPASGGTAG
ncbi:MAG: hypothetical protein HY341_01100 [Candidatus Kerfeldbacteria bacterium]|nr:hypothetical protein [Candidatus Kerfeldbacteria bacterium]